MPLLHMHMTWAKWDKCQTRSQLVKERIANIVSGYPIQKREHGLTSPFQVCILYAMYICSAISCSKPSQQAVLHCFRRYLLVSSFHYVRSDSQSLCSVRTPRALLRGTHHHGRRHSRELTQSIPWGRMVEQVASQAPCRPIKEISTNLFVHGVLSNEEETLTLKCENHCWGSCQIRSSDWLLKVTHCQVPIVQPCPRLPRAWSDWSWVVMLGPIEWFCWSEPFRQEDIHTWISKSFRL